MSNFRSPIQVLEPNTELLRHHGWSIEAAYGPYCVAWRGSEEIVMIWRDDHWERVSGGHRLQAA